MSSPASGGPVPAAPPEAGYGLLVGFTIAAIVGIHGHHLHHTVHIAGSWFTLGGAGGFKALISGVLLAIFLYSGWDTAAYVGEEAEGRKAGPAAVTSVALLFVMYSVVILAFQGLAPNRVMQAHAANILAFAGNLIGGGFWKQVMIVAVLGGTLASRFHHGREGLWGVSAPECFARRRSSARRGSRSRWAGTGSSRAGSAPSASGTGRRGTPRSCSAC